MLQINKDMGIYTPPSHHLEGSRIIKARYRSSCALTGELIKAGDECLYDATYGKVYAKGCSYYKNYINHINSKS